jgi:crossover junction endodeoxyribonuclease RuvC
MMRICGIDPGLFGGLAVIDEGGFVVVDDMPIHEIRSGKKTKRALDLAALRGMLVRRPIDHVVIEQVAARPGQGVTSMFNFGFVAGAITGIVAALQLPYSAVTPQVWQRTAACGPSPDAARRRAGELYPSAAQYLAGKKDAGRADAVLIAHWGLRTLGQRKAA